MVGFPKIEAMNKSAAAMEHIGLDDHLHNLPGQQQRVAIARSIAHDREAETMRNGAGKRFKTVAALMNDLNN